jgi:predicted lipoprotein with Yx(FWY)xxD motif
MIRLERPRGISRGLLLLAPAAGFAVLSAACGSAYGAPAAASIPSTATAAPASVGARASGLGQILTDAQGRTLYLFAKDKGNSSSCDSTCAAVWPPFTTTGGEQAGPGASASLVGALTRSDGTTQVTYNGHPLYYYVGDGNVGDTKGQNLDQFGGGWYVLSPAGAQVGQ